MTMPNTNEQATDVVVAPSLPSVNLLPAEIAQAARFRRFQFAMGGAVVAAVVIVGALYVHSQGAVKSAQADLDNARAQQTAAQAKLASLQSVSDVYSQVAAKQAMLVQAMGQEIDWSNYLADLSLRVPDRVWLTNIQATESSTGLAGPTAPAATSPLTATGIGSINFTGTAFSHDDVATWLDVLAKERGYASPYFTSSTQSLIDGRKVVN